MIDFQDRLATLLIGLCLVATSLWPLWAGWRKGSRTALFRGVIVSAAGSLLLLLVQDTMATAVKTMAGQLHPPLVVATITTLMVLFWTWVWVDALPRLGEVMVHKAELSWHTFGCAVVAIFLVYLAAFVIGPVPGALAHGMVQVGAQDHEKQEKYTAALMEVRAKNVLKACNWLIDTTAALKPKTEPWYGLNNALQSWKLGDNAGRSQKKCATSLAKNSLNEIKAMLEQAAKPLKDMPKEQLPNTINWEKEPESVYKQLAFDQANLTAYFEEALLHPFSHMVKVMGGLNLLVTFILIGEAMSALMLLIEAIVGAEGTRSLRPRGTESNVDTFFN